MPTVARNIKFGSGIGSGKLDISWDQFILGLNDIS